MAWKLVRALRIMSSMSTVVSAYQLTARGAAYAAGLPAPLREEARALAHGPPPHAAELVDVVFDGAGFELRTAGGFCRRTAFAEPEDVSYVTRRSSSAKHPAAPPSPAPSLRLALPPLPYLRLSPVLSHRPPPPSLP